MTRLLLPNGDGVLDIPEADSSHDEIVADLRGDGAILLPPGATVSPVPRPAIPPAMAADLVAALSDLTEVASEREAVIEKRGGGSFTYKYANIADVVTLTRPVLAEHNLVALTPIADTASDRIAVTVRIVHSSGEVLDFDPLTFPRSGNAQDVGSLVTYYRRYALVAALGIAAGDDPDAQHVHRADDRDDRNDRGRPASKRATKKQATRKKAAPPRQEAAAKAKPDDIVKGLIDKHGPEHAARVAVLIGRMNEVEDEDTRKRVKIDFVNEHGALADLGPETYDAAALWLTERLSPSEGEPVDGQETEAERGESAPRATAETEQSDGDDGGPVETCRDPECSVTDDLSNGYCRTHEPF